MSEYALTATCSICGREEEFPLTEEELDTYKRYICYGRQMGYIQDLFPRIPAWIRNGCIDQFSGGFCTCPDCCGGDDEDED